MLCQLISYPAFTHKILRRPKLFRKHGVMINRIMLMILRSLLLELLNIVLIIHHRLLLFVKIVFEKPELRTLISISLLRTQEYSFVVINIFVIGQNGRIVVFEFDEIGLLDLLDENFVELFFHGLIKNLNGLDVKALGAVFVSGANFL
jgi:hypothetical protein